MGVYLVSVGAREWFGTDEDSYGELAAALNRELARRGLPPYESVPEEASFIRGSGLAFEEKLVPSTDGFVSRHAFPTADPMWQYPPGAGLVLWLPGRLPGSYLDEFALLATGCDLAVTVALSAAPRRGGSSAGAWYWVCGVPVLSPQYMLWATGLAAACLAARQTTQWPAALAILAGGAAAGAPAVAGS